MVVVWPAPLSGPGPLPTPAMADPSTGTTVVRGGTSYESSSVAELSSWSPAVVVVVVNERWSSGCGTGRFASYYRTAAAVDSLVPLVLLFAPPGAVGVPVWRKRCPGDPGSSSVSTPATGFATAHAAEPGRGLAHRPTAIAA